MLIIILSIFAAIGAAVLSQYNLKDTKNNSTWVETLFNIEIIVIAVILILIFGIEIALTILTLVLAPFWIWARRQLACDNLYKESMIYQLASSFPLLLIIFIVRAFFIQPYRVPTGSLAPTIHIGDFILVNQNIYGFKTPVLHNNFIKKNKPKRGDIALFYWPIQPKTILVKRVIGLPGDIISYHDHILSINNKPVKTEFIKTTTFRSHENETINVNLFDEYLPNGITHKIFHNTNTPSIAEGDWKVPAGHYFMMGDNRDNSNDSRFWGMVPESSFVGKGMFIWMNFDITALINKDWSNIILWHRIGDKL
jgi:signal peptidase I